MWQKNTCKNLKSVPANNSLKLREIRLYELMPTHENNSFIAVGGVYVNCRTVPSRIAPVR